MSNDATALITTASAAYVLDNRLAEREEGCPACAQNITAGEMYCPRCGYQRGTWGTAVVSAGVSGNVGPLTPWLLRASDGREWRLAAGEQVAGRGEVDIRLDDSFASRRHAKLTASEEGLTVEDLGSSNGTFVNGERLLPAEPRHLADGSNLRIGQAELLVVYAGSEPMAEGGPQTRGESVPATTAPESFQDEVEPEAMTASLSPWQLVAESGQELNLPLGEQTLGRKADRCDQVVEGDTYISGLHCRLLATESTLSITDLGSTNGTFVNDTALLPHTPHELTPGSLVRLGQTTFRVVRTDVEVA